MPFQQKITYVHIFKATVIFAFYGWWVFGVQGIEFFTGPEALGVSVRLLLVL